MTLAVLCPGQGAQHPAMLELAMSDANGRTALDAAADVLRDDPRRWVASDAMFANALAQPLVCVAQNAQWQALRNVLPRPAAVAGYSVGELSSYGIAGAIDIGPLAQLARARADAMDDAAQAQAGTLLAVRGLARRSIDALCGEANAQVAIVTAEDAFVVGGDEAALAAFSARAEAQGAQVRSLRVGVAAHTRALAAAVAPFRAALDRSTLGRPTVPIVAGIDATAVVTRERAIATLAPQVAQTIEWAQCQDALYERGCRTFLELTPGTALSRMVRERFDDIEARAVDEFRSVAGVAAWAARAGD